MADYTVQLHTMLSLQERMNTRVHPEWRQQGYEWYRAIWVECGELMEHQGYKWWKRQTPDSRQVQLEIVDIWHFGLSLLLSGGKAETLSLQLAAEIAACKVEKQSVLLATEALAAHALTTRELSIPAFLSLLQAAGMSFDDLYRAYVGKNVLNFFRQDNGYKEGHYVKQWQGREDNEHLVELAAGLDVGAEDYAERLYAALAGRYRAVNTEV